MGREDGWRAEYWKVCATDCGAERWVELHVQLARAVELLRETVDDWAGHIGYGEDEFSPGLHAGITAFLAEVEGEGKR